MEMPAQGCMEINNLDPNALLQARLFPDMFPLIRQVQIASDFSKGIDSRLAGAEVPSWPDTGRPSSVDRQGAGPSGNFQARAI